MANTAAPAPPEQHFILWNLSPSPAQRRLVLAVILVLLIAFFITAGPLASVQLGQIDAFVPAYATAIFVTDLLTAVLLFAQFSILRSRALLAIASGYLYTSLIVIPWALTFPGVFSPAGLLGAGLQTTPWLYTSWHAGFPTFIMTYALLKGRDPAKGLWQGSGGVAILSSVVATVTLVCVLTFLLIAGRDLLPSQALVSGQFSAVWLYAAAGLTVFIISALIVLWIRRRSVLDLWLMVVMVAYQIEICLISFPVPARFSTGWYAGRVFGLISSSLVLCVLLYEITKLYGQLLHAVLAQHREREARLITGDAVAAAIAHEVKQPLAAMVTNADAGLRMLDRSVPDLDETKAALKEIAEDGRRAAAVIGSIRAMFQSDAPRRLSFDINKLIHETLVLLRSDLQKHEIFVQIDPSPQLPHVVGDHIQLQQVLLNLVTNAIHSMSDEDGPRAISIKSEVQDGGVMISVADTGTGIRPEDVDRIFNPLFTTKSGGMGMGLAICRSIIEAHEGRLWVAGDTPRGAVFKFVLRADPTRSTAASANTSDVVSIGAA